MGQVSGKEYAEGLESAAEIVRTCVKLYPDARRGRLPDGTEVMVTESDKARAKVVGVEFVACVHWDEVRRYGECAARVDVMCCPFVEVKTTEQTMRVYVVQSCVDDFVSQYELRRRLGERGCVDMAMLAARART